MCPKRRTSYLQRSRGSSGLQLPVTAAVAWATVSGRADLLNTWLNGWPDLPEQTGLLNFTACHDGVGLRPLEGLMSDQRLLLLIGCEQRGGLVSHRRRSDGEDVHEINISWWSAMADGGIDPAYLQRGAAPNCW